MVDESAQVSKRFDRYYTVIGVLLLTTKTPTTQSSYYVSRFAE